MVYIYRLVEFNAGHHEQQRKSPNTKLDVCHTNRAPSPVKTAYTVKSLHTKELKGMEK